MFTVSLNPALGKGESLKLTILSSHSHALVPFPAKITQMENQLVVFSGSRLFYSPYPTKTQSSDVSLPSQAIESFTTEGANSRGASITYGECPELC